MAVLLGACGPLGDDDDPTPTLPPVPGGDSSATPGGNASPVASAAATPRSASENAGTPRPTPRPTDDADAPTVSPTPRRAAGTDAEDPTEEPAETPPAEETPAPDDAPEATEGPDPTAVVVEGCEEPDVLPERTGRQNRVVTEDALNLRAGPGTSCDSITSLAVDTRVRVISGVVDAEADDFDWVKVDVEGTEGWVAADFLANPPAE